MAIAKANISDSLTDKKFCVSHVPCHLNRKRIFGAFFIALFLLTGVVGAYEGGDGSEGGPYWISDNADLITLSTDSGNWTQNFTVTANIDLTGVSLTSTIGNITTNFTGCFDGRGYTIRNFEMDMPSDDNIGLFGYLGTGGSITDLGIEAGAEGVRGKSAVGVLVGVNAGGSVTNCFATGNTTADYSVGGLVGDNAGGSITNCSATGNVTATVNYAGGLVGFNTHGSSITNCSATGNVTATGNCAGGLVGASDSSPIRNCYATGNVTATGDCAGGLVGTTSAGGSVTNCYATGSATADGNNAGGLVGWNEGPITNCYATGSAIATNAAGGLVGTSVGGSITNCYYYDGSGATGVGNPISDITKFRDFDFITGTMDNEGLSWSTDIISTDADSSKIWRTFSYRCQYPIFQWQSYETGTLQVDSNPEGAAVSFNGVDTEESTNHSFTGLPEGVYTVTVERAGYAFAPESPDVAVVKGETKTIAFTGFQKYSGGEGTVNRPYEISDSNDLIYLSTHSGDWDQNFTVTANIDLTGGSPTSTIGNATTMFTGHFDGQGHTIRNFEMDMSGDDYVGLFGCLGTGGNITDLGIKAGAEGVHGKMCVGVLVGYNDGGSITNCSATGSATADDAAGGLVGANVGFITNCSATGNTTADHGYAGGLVGFNRGGSLTNCSATGNTTAPQFAGGLVGRNGSSVTNCSATGSVTATGNCAGGLVGLNGGSVMNCYATGSATATGNCAGGLVGLNGGSLENCYATGSATATTNAGGLVGVNVGFNAGGSVTNCYATGSATATNGNCAGGLVGFNDGGSLENCYATGSATATGAYAGGLVGLNDDGSVMNCYYYDADGTTGAGIPISNITKFRDYDFITGTMENDGLNWSTEIISTDLNLSKIWRVFSDKSQYPIFQWQSYGTGTLQIHSNPEGAAIYLDGVNTGKVTNTLLLDVPAGEYTITVKKAGYFTPAGKSITVEKDGVVDVFFRLKYDGGDSDDSAPFVTPKPTPTPTPVPPTATPTVTPRNKFTGTAKLPVGPGGAVERTVKLWADDQSGYLTIDAGVVARDASGRPVENISIVAVPLESIPSPGDVWTIEYPQALYAYNCTPVGVTFSPAINLTFTLTEEEWNLFGSRAEVGWFNSTAGVWEIIAGVPDAGERTITIQVSHFSTYALFAEVAPEVPLPDMTGMPAGSSAGSSLWLWGVLIVALVAVGGIFFITRKKEE